MAFLSEAEVEEILLTKLQTLGYQRASDADIGPDGSAPERESYGDVLLMLRLRAAVDRLNAHHGADLIALSMQAMEGVDRQVLQSKMGDPQPLTGRISTKKKPPFGGFFGSCSLLQHFDVRTLHVLVQLIF
jgi:hypothetical protein